MIKNIYEKINSKNNASDASNKSYAAALTGNCSKSESKLDQMQSSIKELTNICIENKKFADEMK